MSTEFRNNLRHLRKYICRLCGIEVKPNESFMHIQVQHKVPAPRIGKAGDWYQSSWISKQRRAEIYGAIGLTELETVSYDFYKRLDFVRVVDPDDNDDWAHPTNRNGRHVFAPQWVNDVIESMNNFLQPDPYGWYPDDGSQGDPFGDFFRERDRSVDLLELLLQSCHESELLRELVISDPDPIGMWVESNEEEIEDFRTRQRT